MKAIDSVEIEIKLNINQKLFDKGHITEEMYIKAKEMILKKTEIKKDVSVDMNKVMIYNERKQTEVCY